MSNRKPKRADGGVRALETEWRGYRFRSRLEARWAVFLTALNIEWEYEPEGFEFSNGDRYLPDFWLPTFDGGSFVEVKPRGGDFSKARRLNREAGVRIWLAEGPPNARVYTVIEPDGSEELGIPNADQAWGEDRMFVFPGYEDEDGTVPDYYLSCLREEFLAALAESRSARFGT